MILEKKIKGLQLTKTQVKIADYFLENQEEISIRTATDLANILEIGDSSIIRFVRKLGYSNFHSFQKEMRESLIQQFKESRNELSPANKYRETVEKLANNELIRDLLDLTFENIKKTFESIDDEISKIAEAIIGCEKKYILGFRGSSSLVDFFSGKLKYLLPSVIKCTSADSKLFEELLDISERDCLLVYSFPIYTELIKEAIDIALEKKAKIIVITDSLTSPLAQGADHVISASVKGLGFSNSYASVVVINDLLLLEISHKTKDIAKGRVEELEKYLEKYNLH